jgi:hypothetical protein
MADTVTTKIIHDGIDKCTIQITNQSDGTGETSEKKLDLADLIGSNGSLTGGLRPSSLTFLGAAGSVWGFNNVVAYWDRQPTNELIDVFSGDVNIDLTTVGGKADPKRGQDGTGNILISTDGTDDGSGYSLTMQFRKKYD